MSLLSIASRMLRATRNRRVVQSLTELDDRTLADIGLLRTDVHASLALPYFVDPSKALKDACCHWRTFASRFRPSCEPIACC
jgi:uncharacterized protein YjiS (DUF1127 family)